MVLLRRLAPVVALLAAGCAIQFVEEGMYEESFPTSGRPAIELGGIDGDVIVAGVEGQTTAVIRGTRAAVGSTSERARANLRFARLRSRVSSTGLILEFAPPVDKIGLVDLELDQLSHLPQTLGLIVDVDRGDLQVTDLQGALSLESGKGEVEVLGGGPGAVDVETHDGDVTVEALGPITVVADGAALVSVPAVDTGAVDVETSGKPLTFELAPQPVDIFCYPDDGAIVIDPALELEQQPDVADGGTWYKSQGSESPRKVVKLRSNGGDIAVNAWL
jgi:hypothetical protein